MPNETKHKTRKKKAATSGDSATALNEMPVPGELPPPIPQDADSLTKEIERSVYFQEVIRLDQLTQINPHFILHSSWLARYNAVQEPAREQRQTIKEEIARLEALRLSQPDHVEIGASLEQLRTQHSLLVRITGQHFEQQLNQAKEDLQTGTLDPALLDSISTNSLGQAYLNNNPSAAKRFADLNKKIASAIIQTDRSLFLSIPMTELDANLKGNNVDKMLLASKRLTLEVQEEILAQPLQKNRSIIMEKWIWIMHACYKQRDLHATAAIYSALCSNNIFHLTKTKAGLSKLALELLESTYKGIFSKNPNLVINPFLRAFREKPFLFIPWIQAYHEILSRAGEQAKQDEQKSPREQAIADFIAIQKENRPPPTLQPVKVTSCNPNKTEKDENKLQDKADKIKAKEKSLHQEEPQSDKSSRQLSHTLDILPHDALVRVMAESKLSFPESIDPKVLKKINEAIKRGNPTWLIHTHVQQEIIKNFTMEQAKQVKRYAYIDMIENSVLRSILLTQNILISASGQKLRRQRSLGGDSSPPQLSRALSGHFSSLNAAAPMKQDDASLTHNGSKMHRGKSKTVKAIDQLNKAMRQTFLTDPMKKQEIKKYLEKIVPGLNLTDDEIESVLRQSDSAQNSQPLTVAQRSGSAPLPTEKKLTSALKEFAEVQARFHQDMRTFYQFLLEAKDVISPKNKPLYDKIVSVFNEFCINPFLFYSSEDISDENTEKKITELCQYFKSRNFITLAYSFTEYASLQFSTKPFFTFLEENETAKVISSKHNTPHSINTQEIKPIQQALRYELTLKEILENAKKKELSSSFLEELKLTLSLAKAISQAINACTAQSNPSDDDSEQKKRIQATQTWLQSLHDKITDFDDDALREFLKTAPTDDTSAKKSANKQKATKEVVQAIKKLAAANPPLYYAEISTWGNNCAVSCMSVFIVNMLLAGKLTDNAIAKLCKIVSTYYDGAQVTKENLIALFTKYTLPSERQLILGHALRHYIENTHKICSDPNNMMSNEAFKPVAKALGFNVEFYIFSREEEQIKLSGTIPKIKTEDTTLTMKPLYRDSHFDLLMENKNLADKHNRNSLELSTHKLPIEVSQIDELKKIILNDLKQPPPFLLDESKLATRPLDELYIKTSEGKLQKLSCVVKEECFPSANKPIFVEMSLEGKGGGPTPGILKLLPASQSAQDFDKIRYELFFSKLFNLILGDNSAKMTPVYDKSGKIIGLFSEAIQIHGNESKTFHLSEIQRNSGTPPHVRPLNTQQYGQLMQILAASYFLGEEDLHGKNILLGKTPDGTIDFVKIDHDRCGGGQALRNQGRLRSILQRATSRFSSKFNLTPEILTHFPDIQKNAPFYWLTEHRLGGIGQKAYTLGIRTQYREQLREKQYENAKFDTFLKCYLFVSDSILNDTRTQIYGKASDQKQFIDPMIQYIKSQRANLKIQLIATSAFRTYFLREFNRVYLFSNKINSLFKHFPDRDVLQTTLNDLKKEIEQKNNSQTNAPSEKHNFIKYFINFFGKFFPRTSKYRTSSTDKLTRALSDKTSPPPSIEVEMSPLPPSKPLTQTPSGANKRLTFLMKHNSNFLLNKYTTATQTDSLSCNSPYPRPYFPASPPKSIPIRIKFNNPKNKVPFIQNATTSGNTADATYCETAGIGTLKITNPEQSKAEGFAFAYLMARYWQCCDPKNEHPETIYLKGTSKFTKTVAKHLRSLGHRGTIINVNTGEKLENRNNHQISSSQKPHQPHTFKLQG